MGSFDSSNTAGFMTQSILSQRLTTIFNGISVGSFVEFSLNELATLAVFHTIGHGQRTLDTTTMKNVGTAVKIVNVVARSPLYRFNFFSRKHLWQTSPKGTENS